MNSIGDLDSITENIIGCAIEVHRNLGPGLLESIYEKALCHELSMKDIDYSNQVEIPIIYKGISLGAHRLDLLVENEVVVELKAVERMDPVFESQLLSYMKLSGKKIGLLLNFNVPMLKKGIKRFIL